MKKVLTVMFIALLVCMMTMVAFATEPAAEGEATAEDKLITDQIVDWIYTHPEEATVIVTMAVSIFYAVLANKSQKKSVGTLNNNAVAIAETSAATIKEALAGMTGVSDSVNGYSGQVAALLSEVRANAEEKQELKTMLANVLLYLETAKQANVEFSNELAELLVLANIPTSKKDELYARHKAAIEALEAVIPVRLTEEVSADDGEKA